MPQQNAPYWIGKLDGNVRKDQLHIKLLKEAAWRVVVIWECEIQNTVKILRQVKKAIE